MADLPSSIAATDILGTLPRVLIRGNSTGGTNLIVSPSDLISGQDNPQGSLLHLRGGNSSSGGNNGANVRIEGGTGNSTGDGGNLVLRGGAHGGSGTLGFVQLTNNGGDDDSPVYSIVSEGTNSATLFVFVGDQDPNAGNVSALGAGDIYYQSDATTYRASASGTGNWVVQSGGVRRVLDSRSSPHTSALVSSGGGTQQNTIAVGAANGTMVFLLVTTSVTITGDVEFFSDAGRTKPIYSALAHNFAAALAVRVPLFLLGDDGTDLESNSIHYTLTNDGGTDSTFDIAMIVEGE